MTKSKQITSSPAMTGASTRLMDYDASLVMSKAQPTTVGQEDKSGTKTISAPADTVSTSGPIGPSFADPPGMFQTQPLTRRAIKSLVQNMTIEEERLLIAIYTNTPGGRLSLKPDYKKLADLHGYVTSQSANSAYYVMKKKVDKALLAGHGIIGPKEVTAVLRSKRFERTNVADVLLATEKGRSMSEIDDAQLLLAIYTARVFM